MAKVSFEEFKRTFDENEEWNFEEIKITARLPDGKEWEFSDGATFFHDSFYANAADVRADLRRIRKNSGANWSDKEMARLCGLPPAVFKAMARGETWAPQYFVDLIYELARFAEMIATRDAVISAVRRVSDDVWKKDRG